MNAIVSLKVERPFLFHEIARECSRRGFVRDWYSVLTPRRSREAIARDFYRESLDIGAFLRDGGEPGREEIGRLEREYGTPTLWPSVVPDRRLYSLHPYSFAYNPWFRGFDQDHLLRTVGRAFIAAERLFDRARPRLVLLESCVAVDELALYSVARARGVPALLLMDARIGHRWFWTGNYCGVSDAITTTACRLRRREAPPASIDERGVVDQVLRDVRERDARPATGVDALAWMREYRALRPARALAAPARIARSFGQLWRESRDNPYVPDLPRVLADRVGLRLRMVRDRYLTSWEKPVPGEDFVYVPLQMQPEASTALYAPAYLDQLSFVEAIARSIPMTWRLYVKEHPVMIGMRHSAFYRRLRLQPSIRLIDPVMSSHKLSKAARLVCSIAGSATWEAGVLGTPAVQFADTVFTGCRGIARFRGSPEDLSSFLVRAARGEEMTGDFDVEDFVLAVLRNSVTAPTITFANRPGTVTKDDLSVVVDALQSFLGARSAPGAHEAAAE